MNLNIDSLTEEANRLRGCLSDQKTTTSRRRHPPSPDEPLIIGCPFLSDEAKIESSKSWRTLQYRTQVFTNPKNQMVRTRLTHTMGVVADSIIAADMFGLNINLVRAGAMGHDTGHVPLGHAGEIWMAQQMGKNEFCHEILGPIRMQLIERRGRGVNLTFEVLEAMLRHSGNLAVQGMSPEAWLLRHTDKVEYLFHDWNDIAVRMEYPMPIELRKIVEAFGKNQRQRVSTAIAAIVVESAEMGRVSFEESEPAQLFKRLRTMMYDIYPRVVQQKVDDILGPVLDFLSTLGLGDPFLLLALMTDRDVELLRENNMRSLEDLKDTSIFEMIKYLDDIGPIDLCNPDLDWIMQEEPVCA